MSHQHDLDRFLAVATGFCELRMWQDAWDELERLPPEDRGFAEVASIRLRIFIGLKKWESAAILAGSMLKTGVVSGAVFQLGAYGIRRSRTLAEARAFLFLGEPTKQRNPIWHYNLAC